MKLRAPENMGGFSHQGTPVEIPASRQLDITDPVLADVMLSHGFTVVEPPAQQSAFAQAQDVPKSKRGN